MPKLTAHFLEVLYFVPGQNLSDIEREKVIAETCIKQLRSLGCLTTMLGTSNQVEYLRKLPDDESTLEAAKDMDEAFQTLGALQIVIAERLVDAVFKLTNPQTPRQKSKN